VIGGAPIILALARSPGCLPTSILGAASATRESAGAPLPEAERGDVERITAATVKKALGAERMRSSLRRKAM
jgi:hypothetical protein